MIRAFYWTDRRHWEVAFGPFRASRWCDGAPCRYTHNPRHAVRAWRVTGRWTQK